MTDAELEKLFQETFIDFGFVIEPIEADRLELKKRILQMLGTVRDSVVQLPSEDESMGAFREAFPLPSEGLPYHAWAACYRWLCSQISTSPARDMVALLEHAFDSLPKEDQPNKFMPLKRAFIELLSEGSL